MKTNKFSENSEEVKNKLEEMEQETAKLRELHSQLSSESTNGVTHPTDEEKRDTDARSIYIGNVDYGSTPLELQQHFSSAGVVNRVTILTNKFTGQPKGFAYLEFADTDAVNKAVATLDGSTFRERQLKVLAKRTNIPGISVKRGFLEEAEATSEVVEAEVAEVEEVVLEAQEADLDLTHIEKAKC